jgi:uncharacterized membrane protein (UPF0127 family)
MNRISLKIFIVLILSIFCLGYSFAQKQYSDGDIVNVNINCKTLKLVAAISPNMQAKGLSDIEEIPYDGMMFFFQRLQKRAFWMKGMRFPIDIVWIAGNKVIEISENVPTEPSVSENYLKRYAPLENTDTVIELSSGRAKQLNIKRGNIIIFK